MRAARRGRGRARSSRQLRGSASVEAVGVCLLWSIVNPAHELRVGELLAEHLPGVPYTLSHRLNPTLREYRRASSAVHRRVAQAADERATSATSRRGSRAPGFGGRLLIVTSSGGVLDADDVAEPPIHSIDSGPAMAPVAGRHYARVDAGARHGASSPTPAARPTTSASCGAAASRGRARPGRAPDLGHMTGFPSVDVQSRSAPAAAASPGSTTAACCTSGPQSAGADARARRATAAAATGRRSPTRASCSATSTRDYFLGGDDGARRRAAREAAIRRDVAEPLGLDARRRRPPRSCALATEQMVHGDRGDHARSRGSTRAAGAGRRRRRGGPQRGRRSPGGSAARSVVVPDVAAALWAAGALMSDLPADFAATDVTSTATLRRRRAPARSSRELRASSASAFVARRRRRRRRADDRASRSRRATRTRSGSSRCRCAGDRFDDAGRRRGAARGLPRRPRGAVRDRATPTRRSRSSAGAPASAARCGEARPARRRAEAATRRAAPSAARLLRRGWAASTPPVRRLRRARRPASASQGPLIVESPVTTVVLDPDAAVRAPASGSLSSVADPWTVATAQLTRQPTSTASSWRVLSNRFEGDRRAR